LGLCVTAKFKQGGNACRYSAWRRGSMKTTREERRRQIDELLRTLDDYVKEFLKEVAGCDKITT